MTVLQALNRYYDRLESRGDVVGPGYSVEPIGVVITLTLAGSIADVMMWRNSTGQKPRPERVPKWFGRSGTGSTPYFLWDNSAYALGVSSKEPGKTSRDHNSFKEYHAQHLSGINDGGLLALVRFIDGWKPEQFVAPLFTSEMLNLNFAFRLEGEQLLLHERPAAGALVQRLYELDDQFEEAERAFCLVLGDELPISRLHPKIKGVDGTASAEVPLVSFNEPAFVSQGQKQGANAPTSKVAAFRYTAALNRLLERGTSRNRMRIGDATVVFWADAAAVTASAEDAEAAAAAAEDTFAALFDPASAWSAPDDATEAVKLRDALEAVAKGRPLRDLDPRLVAGTRFYVLGLAPNAARLAVRFWLTDTFEHFAEHLSAHYRDLAIEPKPRGWGNGPAVQWLLVRTTALREKFEKIPPLLSGEVTRAVLTGSPYPRTMLAAAIIRLRAGDAPGSGWHAAVIKACLNRNPAEKEELPVALDPDNPSPAYQLGRLFAVLEAAQYAALGRVNAPIGVRYYGAASATPARVFGPLLRGLQNHISDARKRGRGGWIERKVAEVISKLPPELPRSLRFEDQGRFAIGYYHERAMRFDKANETGTEGENNNE
jgi:CRISPR-associated protein Csd1